MQQDVVLLPSIFWGYHDVQAFFLLGSCFNKPKHIDFYLIFLPEASQAQASQDF